MKDDSRMKRLSSFQLNIGKGKFRSNEAVLLKLKYDESEFVRNLHKNY